MRVFLFNIRRLWLFKVWALILKTIIDKSNETPQTQHLKQLKQGYIIIGSGFLKIAKNSKTAVAGSRPLNIRRKEMTKKEIATRMHESGYNCAQAVACAFSEEIGVDESTLYRICEGFGGGLGCAKGQCGALSGAVVLAGLKNSDGDIEHPAGTKKETTKLSRQMLEIFVDRAGALICADLKGAGSGKPITSCADCINIGVEAVEEVLGL